MDSIFEGIVRDENDHTRLLANLAERHPLIAVRLLSLFSNGNVSNADPMRLSIESQWVCTDEDQKTKIPDMRIKADRLTCLLEVKIRDSLPLNDAQRKAYHTCFEGEDERYFCLLVRSISAYAHELPSLGQFAAQNKISFHYITWADLLTSLEEIVEPLKDDVATEITSFLKRRFEVVKWKPEERTVIESWQEKDPFLAIRKLEKVIEQTKTIAEASGYKAEGEYSDPQSYGFYLQSPRRYSIWIGAWSEANSPIALAVKVSDHELNSVAEKDVGVAESISKDQKWRLYSLRGVDWTAPQKLWHDIEQCLPSLLNLAREY